MLKKIIMILLISVLVVGCSANKETEKQKIKVAALKGPTGMGMVQLMEKNENNQTKLDYEMFMI
ncbi:NitT/TauT family transport system substrate-binding protein [Alkalithermobacter thermoalcaliphilus JW-YL-7 = DSM 7308]|uniref:NitT/TauT family transport system substrate-binding protein n=1 Tax=Alkalithermobacter thermoalcaliphilus JW-YL-7 = DSM 7308 TaxID=1121328 RepID=A0A150FS41_CLOPD|nr:hypothetical protein JWYL7_1512 [[Clostridium] paradoxum JW-YL-7 = DSM 7308]SHK32396.1 NitT/TauT family transport system substrate-binding protein [[Clostridium] paradoxum JW-YL-7 = DSM 7308]